MVQIVTRSKQIVKGNGMLFLEWACQEHVFGRMTMNPKEDDEELDPSTELP
ncbi:hypothetical protein SP19_181 [Salmonella phage 19]|nr:hypothetical protein SP19_181 [Salmonella phage 19]